MASRDLRYCIGMPALEMYVIVPSLISTPGRIAYLARSSGMLCLRYVMCGSAIPPGGLQDTAGALVLHLLHLCSHLPNWIGRLRGLLPVWHWLGGLPDMSHCYWTVLSAAKSAGRHASFPGDLQWIMHIVSCQLILQCVLYHDQYA